MTRFLTLTVNPALDLWCEVDVLAPTHKTRVPGYHVDPGGGGINVARVLRRLGARACAIVLVGGHSGAWLVDLLRAEGLEHVVVPVGAATRISFDLLEASGHREYRIVPDGEPVSAGEAAAALAVLEDHAAHWLVASGSLAPGLPDDFYRQVAARKGAARVAVDCSGRGLLALRGAGIDLLKLSRGELAALTGASAETLGACALALVRDGTARMVAVTLGEQGAVLAVGDELVRLPARPVEVRSTVGAGDAFLAGLVLALDHGLDAAAALAGAIDASAAALASVGTARP